MILLDLYKDFVCKASDCEFDCCTGWKIEVDKQTYSSYKQIKNETLRKYILGNIFEMDGRLYFTERGYGCNLDMDELGLDLPNETEYSCSMLNKDGLCVIQKNLGEEFLSFTCKKFPRLVYMNSEKVYLSMSAACPIVARYLINEKVSFIVKDESTEEGLLFDDFLKEIRKRSGEIRDVVELDVFSGLRKRAILFTLENYFIYRTVTIALKRMLKGEERLSAIDELARIVTDEVEELFIRIKEVFIEKNSLTQDDLIEIICKFYRLNSHTA